MTTFQLPFQDPQSFFVHFLTVLKSASSHKPENMLVLLLVSGLSGIVYTFFGKKAYEGILYTTGFFSGVVLGHSLHQMLPLAAGNPVWIYWVLLSVCGLLGLFLVHKIVQMALFLLGGVSFLLLAHPLLLVMEEKVAFLVLLLVFVAGGTLAVLLKDWMLILTTATAGSYLLTFSSFALAMHFRVIEEKSLGTIFSVFYIAWGVFGFLGIVAQLRNTRKESKAKN